MNLGTTQTPAPVRQGEISATMDALRAKLKTLEQVSTELTERLAPMVRPQPEKPTDKPDSTRPNAQLARDIDDAGRLIEAVTESLSDTLQCLEI